MQSLVDPEGSWSYKKKNDTYVIKSMNIIYLIKKIENSAPDDEILVPTK